MFHARLVQFAQHLKFSVRTCLLLIFLSGIPLGANSASQDSIDLATQMYVAYYGRPGDPSGVIYWAEQFNQSSNLSAVLSAFGNSPEYTANFGTLSNAQLVNGLFQQMFNRASDAGGLAFYVDRLQSGVATLASIAKQIADGAVGADRVTLNNKIAIANAFTDHIDSNGLTYQSTDIASVRELLAAVTDSSSSVNSALNDVADFGIELPKNISPILDFLLNS